MRFGLTIKLFEYYHKLFREHLTQLLTNAPKEASQIEKELKDLHLFVLFHMSAGQREVNKWNEDNYFLSGLCDWILAEIEKRLDWIITTEERYKIEIRRLRKDLDKAFGRVINMLRYDEEQRKLREEN